MLAWELLDVLICRLVAVMRPYEIVPSCFTPRMICDQTGLQRLTSGMDMAFCSRLAVSSSLDVLNATSCKLKAVTHVCCNKHLPLKDDNNTIQTLQFQRGHVLQHNCREYINQMYYAQVKLVMLLT
jgi:hypothetical protein